MNDTDLRGSVDLETFDTGLDDLVIKEYQGVLTEGQHQIIRQGRSRLYRFLKLRVIYLIKLLQEHGENYSYVVRTSSDNKVLMSRRIVKLEYCPN